MKIATWNVNSVRARLGSVLLWLQTQRPDVLCLQETKVEDTQFPKEAFREMGYFTACYGQKAYNGVAILSLAPPDALQFGFPKMENTTDWNEQKRMMTATFGNLTIINVYLPNGESVDSSKFEYKLNFMQHLRDWLDQTYPPNPSVILTGDFNVAPEAIDVYAPEAWQNEVIFHPSARQALTHLAAWGFVDLFRKHHAEGGQYTWWDYRALAFSRNWGLRIDHIWGSVPVAQQCSACEIDRAPRAEPRPSDHTPMMATLTIG